MFSFVNFQQAFNQQNLDKNSSSADAQSATQHQQSHLPRPSLDDASHPTTKFTDIFSFPSTAAGAEDAKQQNEATTIKVGFQIRIF